MDLSVKRVLNTVACIMVCAMSHALAATGPAEVAVAFLEKIRTESVDLEPGTDTAITDYVTPEKREEIAHRLKRIGKEFGPGELVVVEVKEDEDAAGVLVSKAEGFDPDRLRVFGIALLKQNGTWLPAPIPSSFENTRSSYQPELRDRVGDLEMWLLSRKVILLEQLREQAKVRMRQEITKSISAEELAGMTAKQAVERFIAACVAKDQAQMLAFLGGLEESFPADWNQILTVTNRAVTADWSNSHPWRLLLAPEVLRVPMVQRSGIDDTPDVLACLHPGYPSSPAIWMLPIGLSRQPNGLWRIELPQVLMQYESRPYESLSTIRSAQLEEFLRELRDRFPLAPQSDFETAANVFGENLERPDLSGLLSGIALDDSVKIAEFACTRVARIWQEVHPETDKIVPVPLATHQVGSRGVAVFQFFSVSSPKKSDIRTFFFNRSDQGWLMQPEENSDGAEVDGFDEVQQWVGQNLGDWRNAWVARMFSDAELIESIPSGNPASKQASRELIEAWIAKIRAADVRGALQLVATFNDERGFSKAIQNLSFEIKNSESTSESPKILAELSGKTWTAIGVESSTDDKQRPLYAVINTANGPRLLLEADLFAGGNRGRDFLNRTSIDRVAKFTEPEVADELRELLEKFGE